MVVVFSNPCEQATQQEIITKPEEYIIEEDPENNSSATSLGRLFTISYQLLNQKTINLKDYEVLILTSTTNPSKDYPRAARPFYDEQNLFVENFLRKIYQQLVHYKKKNLDVKDLRAIEKVLFIPLHWPSIPWSITISKEAMERYSEAITQYNIEEVNIREIIKPVSAINNNKAFSETQQNISAEINADINSDISFVKLESFYDIEKQSQKNFKKHTYEELKTCCNQNRDLELEAILRFLKINKLQEYMERKAYQKRKITTNHEQYIQADKQYIDKQYIAYYGRKSSFEAKIAREVANNLGLELHIIGRARGGLENLLKSYRHDAWLGEAHNSALNLLLGFLRKEFRRIIGFTIDLDLKSF